jgi:hypothetical protein
VQQQAHLGYVIAARFSKYFSMWSFAFFTGVATSTAFSTTCSTGSQSSPDTILHSSVNTRRCNEHRLLGNSQDR